MGFSSEADSVFTDTRAQEPVHSEISALWSTNYSLAKIICKEVLLGITGIANSLCQITPFYPDNIRTFIQLFKGQKTWRNLEIAMTLNFYFTTRNVTVRKILTSKHL